MASNPTQYLPHSSGANSIYSYYAPSSQQSGQGSMPQAFGSGQPARWIPRGLGSMPEELSALFRIAAHDAYSGVDQHGHSYIDGDLVYKAMFFPDDPAVKPLLERDYLRNALVKYGMMDLQDDGRINGSPARRIFADAMWHGWGIDISQQLNSAPLRDADLSWQALSRPNVDNGTPEGFKIQADWMGLSPYELGAMVTGGHDWIPQPLDDGWGNGSTLVNAMNNPMHPDYKNTNGVPGLKGYFQQLIRWDQQRFGQLNGWHLAQDMASAILKMFHR